MCDSVDEAEDEAGEADADGRDRTGDDVIAGSRCRGMDRVEAEEGRSGQKDVVKELVERTGEWKDDDGTKAKAGDGVIVPEIARFWRSQRKGRTMETEGDGDSETERMTSWWW